MEQMRMLSQRTRITGTLLNFTNQGPRTAQMDLDIITAPMEVAYRARAFFMTTAYVCIRRRDWMDLQCAVFAADKIQDLALATSGGTLAPVEHLVDAWTSTIHYWSEQVRINGANLKDVINNTGGWENKWQWNNTNANSAASDLPANLAHDAATVRELARQQQSANDRARAAERAAAGLGTPVRRDRDAGSKGGGKRKGKGKNDDKGRSRQNDNHRNGGRQDSHRDRPRSRDRRGERR